MTYRHTTCNVHLLHQGGHPELHDPQDVWKEEHLPPTRDGERERDGEGGRESVQLVSTFDFVVTVCKQPRHVLLFTSTHPPSDGAILETSRPVGWDLGDLMSQSAPGKHTRSVTFRGFFSKLPPRAFVLLDTDCTAPPPAAAASLEKGDVYPPVFCRFVTTLTFTFLKWSRVFN